MIRPVLEYTCPVWHSGLTVEHRSQPYRRHVHAYFLTCLSRSTVATHSSGHTRRSGRCCFRLRPRVDDSSAHCQNRGGEWQDAIQARFNAASELRAHNAGGSRERWTTFADAALQLRHQSVRSLQRIELCSGCLERAWLVVNVWRQHGGAQSCRHIRHRRLTSECVSAARISQFVDAETSSLEPFQRHFTHLRFALHLKNNRNGDRNVYSQNGDKPYSSIDNHPYMSNLWRHILRHT